MGFVGEFKINFFKINQFTVQVSYSWNTLNDLKMWNITFLSSFFDTHFQQTHILITTRTASYRTDDIELLTLFAQSLNWRCIRLCGSHEAYAFIKYYIPEKKLRECRTFLSSYLLKTKTSIWLNLKLKTRSFLMHWMRTNHPQHMRLTTSLRMPRNKNLLAPYFILCREHTYFIIFTHQ